MKTQNKTYQIRFNTVSETKDNRWRLIENGNEILVSDIIIDGNTYTTKDWLPEYGGLLHFMDDEKEIIERVEIPTFNTLTLFYLPPGKGKWHFVSHVAPGVPELRLSYTGWFK